MFDNILIICVGNICRSPTAEVLLKHQLGDTNKIIHSAGLGALVGKNIEPTALEILQEHGITPAQHVARQLTSSMLAEADLILAMDRDNLATLERLGSRSGLARRGDVRRFLQRDVPDPYYGGPEGFQTVFDMLDEGCDRLLRDLTQGV